APFAHVLVNPNVAMLVIGKRDGHRPTLPQALTGVDLGRCRAHDSHGRNYVRQLLRRVEVEYLGRRRHESKGEHVVSEVVAVLARREAVEALLVAGYSELRLARVRSVGERAPRNVNLY